MGIYSQIQKAEIRQKKLDRSINEWVTDGNLYDIKPDNIKIPGLPVMNFIEERRLNFELRDLGKKRHRVGIIHDTDHNRFLDRQLGKPELRSKIISKLLDKKDHKMLTRISVTDDLTQDIENYRNRRRESMYRSKRELSVNVMKTGSGKSVTLSQTRPFTYTYGTGTGNPMHTRSGHESPTRNILPNIQNQNYKQRFGSSVSKTKKKRLPPITSNPKFNRLEQNLCKNFDMSFDREITGIVRNVDSLHVPSDTIRVSKAEIGHRIRNYLIECGIVSE